jgi:hypothetical protein
MPTDLYRVISASFSRAFLAPVKISPSSACICAKSHSPQYGRYRQPDCGFQGQGVLTVLFNEEEFELMPGDSFHVESSQPHNWYNRTKEPVKLLCVYSHSRLIN